MTDVETHPRVQIANLGAEVNSASDDYASTYNDNRLLFTSNRPTAEGYIHGDDIWFSDRERNAWSKSLDLGGTVNSELDEGAPCIPRDGSTVYFVQCWTDDGLGDGDIYMANFTTRGQWQGMRNLGDAVNSRSWDSHPFLSGDGEDLYFASNRPGGYGGTDIWVSKKMRSGKWAPPRNLGPVINTSGNEKAPMLAPNGNDLFFSSDGHPSLGGFDLFISTNTKKGWGAPRNIGMPFNSPGDDLFFRLSAEEDTVFISSNREGGYGGMDLYLLSPNPFKDTTRYVYYLAGAVVDSATSMGIAGARLSIRGGDGETREFTADRSGRYRLRTHPDEQFELSATAPNYEPRTIRFKIPPTLSYNEYRKSIALPSIASIEAEKPDTGDVPNLIVYFDFDKYDLRPQEQQSLGTFFSGELKPLLDAKQEFDLKLDAHTDDTGSEDYNLRLSRRRGAAVAGFLAKRGIPRSGIETNAYGETRPATANESEEGRQKNRRVEITIRTRAPITQ